MDLTKDELLDFPTASILELMVNKAPVPAAGGGSTAGELNANFRAPESKSGFGRKSAFGYK